MRLLIKSLFYLLIAMILFQSAMMIIQWFDSVRQDKNLQQFYEQANDSIVYFPVNNEWLEFSIEEKSQLIRILSNAMISRQITADDQIWHYALQYQLIDKNNNRIDEKIYHHRSKINWVNNASQKRVSRRFFQNNGENAASTQQILIPNNSESYISKVRIRMHSADNDIMRLGLRLYSREQLNENKIKYAWQALSEAEKETLAFSNIYPVDLLRESEKYHLLRYRWKPSGPSGIEQENYLADKIYIFDQDFIEEIDDTPYSRQVSASENYTRTYQLPETLSLISLQITAVDNSGIKPLAAQLSWHGKGIGKFEQFQLSSQENSAQEKSAQEQNSEENSAEDQIVWKKELESGLLQVSVNQDVDIAAWIQLSGKDPEKVKLQSREKLLRSFILGPENPLQYPLETLGSSLLPIRVDIRKLLSREDKPIDKAFFLHFELMDQAGQSIDSGNLKLKPLLSEYDRVLNDETPLAISLPQRWYLHAPENAVKIKFSAKEPLLLNIYNRPPAFAHYSKIPENYDHFSQSNTIPLWFSIKPLNFRQMQKDKDYILSLTQKKPDEDDNGFIDHYSWQDYKPDNNWAARYLLQPRNPDLPLQDKSLAGIYKKTAINKKISVNFSGQKGLKTLRPTLIYVKKSSKPEPIDIFVDKQKLLSRQLYENNGQIVLPSIKTGKHLLQISAPPGNYYLNYQKTNKTDDLFLKRLSLRLQNQRLSFTVDKNKDEMLISALFQSAYNSHERTRILVTIEPIRRETISNAYTIEKRLFDIKPDNHLAIRILNTTDQYLGIGRRFYIPLGNDLKQGKYRIRISRLEGPQGYLSLYHFAAGKDQSHRFFTQEILD